VADFGDSFLLFQANQGIRHEIVRRPLLPAASPRLPPTSSVKSADL
jgi:hypothetical protein